MNPEPESKTIKVKSRINLLAMIFGIFWIGLAIAILASKFGNYESFEKLNTCYKILIVFAFIFTIGCIYELLWFFFGETTFTISSSKSLVVTSGILFFKKTNTYFINQISGVRISSEVPSLKFMGISLTTTSGFQGVQVSESKIPVICFNYNNQKIVLGSDLSSFDLETLKKWISN